MSFIKRICGLGIYHSGKAPAWHTSGSGSVLQDCKLSRTMDPLSRNCTNFSQIQRRTIPESAATPAHTVCFHKSFPENCLHRTISTWCLRSSSAYGLSQEYSMAKITDMGLGCLTASSAYGFSNRLTRGQQSSYVTQFPLRQTQNPSKISAMAKTESFRKGEKWRIGCRCVGGGELLVNKFCLLNHWNLKVPRMATPWLMSNIFSEL